MLRADALQQAVRLATLIKAGDRQLARRSLGNVPLLAMLPILDIGSFRRGRDDLDEIPQRHGGFVREILIFGSTASGREYVADLDMMVLDSGYYSPFFESKDERHDWYTLLADNIDEFLSGWLGYEDWKDDPWLDASVDLHILPVSVLWSEYARSRIGRLHHDPHFLDHAFSSILRFNEENGCFEPMTSEELRLDHSPKRDDEVKSDEWSFF